MNKSLKQSLLRIDSVLKPVNNIFSWSSQFYRNLAEKDRVILKLLLLRENKTRFDYEKDIYTNSELLKKLKIAHPNVELSDLKSLTKIYSKLTNYPNSIFQSTGQGNNNYKILTNQDVINLIKRNLDNLIKDNPKVLDFLDYILINKSSQHIYAKTYESLSDTVFNSSFSYNYFYSKFMEYDEIIYKMQQNIHDIATSCDYDNSDLDDTWDMGVQFDNYTDEVLDELKAKLNDYYKFINKNDVDQYIYNNHAQKITIQNFLNFIDRYKFDDKEIY